MLKYMAVNLISSAIVKLAKNSLYRNSFWLMAGSFIMAGIGFAYWIIAARLYTPSQVGLAATFLSSAALINLIGMLGFSTTLIRYIPTSATKEKKINTSFTIVALATIITGIVYLVGIPFWATKLTFLTESFPVFFLSLIFFPFNMINTLTDSVFTAYRESQWVLVSNSTQSVTKLVLLILLPTFGVWGIIGSNILGVVIATILCFFLIYHRFGIRFRPMIDNATIQKVKKYALENYFLTLISGMPILLLPIIITNRISSEQTAYFYIPNMIASLLAIIPTMISRSYLTEGSYHNRAISIKNPLLISYGLLLPLNLVLLLFGRRILTLFGNNYAVYGYSYLVLISVSTLISVINYFLGTKLIIEHRLKEMIIINTISSSSYLGAAWILTPIGINGIGISSIFSQILGVLLLLIIK